MNLSLKYISLGDLIGPFNFTYSNRDGFSIPLRIHYPIDLDGDGIEELVLAGGETQPNTPETYTASLINIFGWKNNSFQNITQDWLPASINEIDGTGSIAFGDFNGDSLLDFYLGGSADMEYAISSYQYINHGTHFVRKNLGVSMWEHGYAVHDLNQDGFDDVIPFGWSSMANPLIGGTDGLKRSLGGSISGSGGVVADFLGNGSNTLIVVDHDGGAQDTRLFTFSLSDSGDILETNLVANLPIPILETSDFLTDNYDKSHDVRVVAFDFTKDNLIDAIVFSRGGFDGRRWVEKSAVQFLKNNGNGEFIDVTDLTLKNYHTESYVGYNPILRDFDLDGWVDIFHSDNSWEGVNDSSSLIFGNHDGTFTDFPRDIFSNLLPSWGGMSSIVLGPNGINYLVIEEVFYGGSAQLKLYPINFPFRSTGEDLYGSSLDDSIFGLAGNDHIFAKKGNDSLDGGVGVDIAIYEGTLSDYAITTIENNSFMVSDSFVSRDGTDTLINIERLQFSDLNLALDIDGTPGQAYRLYKAALDRAPDLEGLGFWIAALDRGASLRTVAEGFVNSPEFRTKFYGDGANNTFVTALYNNVLDRQSEPEGFNFWVSALDRGASRAEVLIRFSESPENTNNTAELIAAGIVYQEWVG